MSVPMTFSERERRNARGHIFQGINLLMLEQFVLERPNLAGCDCDSAHFQESPLQTLRQFYLSLLIRVTPTVTGDHPSLDTH